MPKLLINLLQLVILWTYFHIIDQAATLSDYLHALRATKKYHNSNLLGHIHSAAFQINFHTARSHTMFSSSINLLRQEKHSTRALQSCGELILPG